MSVSLESCFTGTEFEDSEDVYTDKSKDLNWQECAERFKRNKAFLKEVEKEQEFLRQQMIFMAQDKNCSGSGIVLEKSKVKGHIDYSIIPELLAVDLELYRKHTQTRWRITEI